MKLSNEELVLEFYKLNKDKYPDITLEQAKEICPGPWKYLKYVMESGELFTVRFKYFGTFQVYAGRAVSMLQKLKERYRFNKIKREEYFKLKDMLEKFIKRNENKI